MSEKSFDTERARVLREQATGTFAKLIRQGLVSTVLLTIPCIALLSYAGMRWGSAGDPETARYWSLLYFLGFIFLVVIWAILAITGRQLFLVKEIKQLRLDFLEAREISPQAATGGAESFVEWTGMALRPKAVGMLMAGVGMAAAVGTFVVSQSIESYLRANSSTFESFGGQEVVDFHVMADGRLRAYSRVSITKCPSSIALLPIHIVQPGAVLESAAIGGREVPFSPEPGKEGVYSLMPGLPENALMNATLEVVYLLPAVAKKGETLKFELQGLVPITSYAANVLIEPGAPYRFSGEELGAKTLLPLFWTRRPAATYDDKYLGYCGIGVEPVDGQ